MYVTNQPWGESGAGGGRELGLQIDLPLDRSFLIFKLSVFIPKSIMNSSS